MVIDVTLNRMSYASVTAGSMISRPVAGLTFMCLPRETDSTGSSVFEDPVEIQTWTDRRDHA